MNLAVFDLDGTIIKEEFLVELGRAVGKKKEIAAITKLGLEGKIDWQEGLDARIEILKGVDEKTSKAVAEKFTLKDGVLKAFAMLKENNFKIAIITGGFDLQARKVCKLLGADYLACNKIVFDRQNPKGFCEPAKIQKIFAENGKLTGAKIFVNCNKDKWLKFFVDMNGAKITLAFGDGANDLGMIEAATYGKILKPEENILEEVQKAINIFKPLAEIGVR